MRASQADEVALLWRMQARRNWIDQNPRPTIKDMYARRLLTTPEFEALYANPIVDLNIEGTRKVIHFRLEETE